MQRILESKINTARVDFYKLLGNDDLQITAVPRISVYIYIYIYITQCDPDINTTTWTVIFKEERA